MGIKNDSHVATSLFNLFVHLGKASICEVGGIKLKVLVAIWGLVVELVRPLDVHDVHVDREFKIGKIPVSLHDSVSANPIVLRKVETKGVQRRQGSETSHSRNFIRYSLVPV